MNVWKYIYIQFFKIRCKIIGPDGADEYTAVVYVGFFDMLYFFGIILLIDKLTDNIISTKYPPLILAISILVAFTMDWLRDRSMCKNGAFERIKKEVENEPNKLKWNILSILYIIFAILFFVFCLYIKYPLKKYRSCF